MEARLRSGKNRMLHVLYALSIRGRTDHEGRSGWATASDVLGWLFEQYEHLKVDLPDPVGRPTDRWYYSRLAPTPRLVIKRDGPPRRFARHQFVASIRRAMLGRPNAREQTECIAEWVLWHIAGPEEVLSSQLMVGVLDCLRRVDDIAYLRWVSIAKGFDSATRFRDEAFALVADPSPRLVFDPEHAVLLPSHTESPRPSTALASLAQERDDN